MESSTQATMFDRLRDGGDAVAWDQFFQRYWRLIFAFARRLGCSEHTSEEIVQDVMLAVFNKREVFCYDPAKGSFRNWLCTVVRNTVGKHRGKAAERYRAPGGESSQQPEIPADHALPDVALEETFEKALLVVLLNLVQREVSPQTYQAFELTARHGLSGAEAARITGLRRDAVYAARARVLARLRELGVPYREDGQLAEQIRQACDGLVCRVDEASLSKRVGETLRSV